MLPTSGGRSAWAGLSCAPVWGPPTLTADKRKYPFVGFPPRPELEHCLTPPGGAHSLYLHLLPEHRELWVHRHRPHLGMVRIAAPRPPAPTGSAHRSPVPSSRLWGPRCERVAQSRRLSQPVAHAHLCLEAAGQASALFARSPGAAVLPRHLSGASPPPCSATPLRPRPWTTRQ